MIRSCTSFFMTVTAFHSTSQTPSRYTRYCFTRRPYHSLPQIRASSRNFITAACQKLFAAWIRCGLQSYFSSEAIKMWLIPSQSRLIISGSQDMIIRVWDASTGIEVLPSLRGHDHWIHSVAFSPDGSKIISGSSDATIRVWDASTGIEMLTPLRGHHMPIYSVVFSPDGSKIILASDDDTIRILIPSYSHPMDPKLSQSHLARFE